MDGHVYQTYVPSSSSFNVQKLWSSWQQVRYVPNHINNWSSSVEDQLLGTEVYGDPTDNSQPWAVAFDISDINKFKIERKN